MTNDTKGTVIPFPDARTKRAQENDAVIAAIEPGHALVPVNAGAPTGSHAETRRDSAFLAHLIAAKAQAPQTRERRRAEPGEAVQAYQLSLETVHRTGQAFAYKS